ncbi:MULTISPECIES: hypothetical protein [unclassified Streptomyces]|uniref:hypothetical protein n=1 Tax=unclassified Streptomyces TaxID=2593676 RepID=UPI00382B34FC
MSTVSGRRYTRTRPRGFVAWNPRPATKLLIEQILAVLDEYADDLPLTARMVFYRLVGAYDFSSTPSEISENQTCRIVSGSRAA